MKNIKYYLSFCLLISVLVGVLSVAFAQDEVRPEDYDQHTIVKTVDGLNFEVEEDRPIIQKEGYIAPLDYNKYISTF